MIFQRQPAIVLEHVPKPAGFAVERLRIVHDARLRGPGEKQPEAARSQGLDILAVQGVRTFPGAPPAQRDQAAQGGVCFNIAGEQHQPQAVG